MVAAETEESRGMRGCLVCETPLPVQSGRGRPRKYCTQHGAGKDAVAVQERREHSSLKHDERRRIRSEQRLRDCTKQCADCGITFVAKTPLPQQIRCVRCACQINVTRYRHIRRATAHVHNAIKAGRLADPKTLICADCGGSATEYDHRDYTQPLFVEPVCHPCNFKRGPGHWPLTVESTRVTE